MTYRSLLVFLDRDPLCAARTLIAMRLAKDLDCHLVGIAPTRLINLPVSPEAAASFADFTALAWDTLRDRAEQTTQRFSGRKGPCKSPLPKAPAALPQPME